MTCLQPPRRLFVSEESFESAETTDPRKPVSFSASGRRGGPERLLRVVGLCLALDEV